MAPQLKFNPFKPGSIIHPGMFAGRTEELKTLERALYQTENGNPNHFLIYGERGIGKSSLLMVVDALASGEITSLFSRKYSFLTVNVDLEPKDNYPEIICKVARELQRELDKSQAIQKSLKDIWKFITSWEVLGVKYKRDTTPVDAMIEELADKFVAISAKLKETNQGIFIFIDEADKAPADAGLGEFVKVFTERLSKRGAGNVGLGIIGITNVIDKMRHSHESSVRILTPIPLEPLLPNERIEVVQRGLKEAENKNDFKTEITEEALKMISNFSEGYPHFIQQYAYSAYEEDTDKIIDKEDIRTALIKENGALQLLGMRYFENMYTDEIRSDDYRTVLQVIAQQHPKYITRKEIVSKSGLKSHTVNNAITALKKRGSVVQKRGTAGQFRLPSQSFAAWILAFKIAN